MLCFSSALWMTWGVWSWLVSCGQDTVRVCLDCQFAEASQSRMRSGILLKNQVSGSRRGTCWFKSRLYLSMRNSSESFDFANCKVFFYAQGVKRFGHNFTGQKCWQCFCIKTDQDLNIFCSVSRQPFAQTGVILCLCICSHTVTQGQRVSATHWTHEVSSKINYSKPKVFNVIELNVIV